MESIRLPLQFDDATPEWAAYNQALLKRIQDTKNPTSVVFHCKDEGFVSLTLEDMTGWFRSRELADLPQIMQVWALRFGEQGLLAPCVETSVLRSGSVKLFLRLELRAEPKKVGLFRCCTRILEASSMLQEAQIEYLRTLANWCDSQYAKQPPY